MDSLKGDLRLTRMYARKSCAWEYLYVAWFFSNRDCSVAYPYSLASSAPFHWQPTMSSLLGSVLPSCSPHGLAEAGMVRVANAMGRNNMHSVRLAGFITFAIGTATLIVLSVFPLYFPEPLVKLFLDESDPGFELVLELATHLLVLAAFFQIFDGLQVMASMALRGIKDTLVPLWLAALGYWVFGMAGGWTLAFPLEMGAEGLWWGMAAGLTITGSLLALRFYFLTRK